MKFPKPQSSGIGTTGAVGVSLIVLHLTGFVIVCYWPIIYILFILSAIGQENRKG